MFAAVLFARIISGVSAVYSKADQLVFAGVVMYSLVVVRLLSNNASVLC